MVGICKTGQASFIRAYLGNKLKCKKQEDRQGQEEVDSFYPAKLVKTKAPSSLQRLSKILGTDKRIVYLPKK